MNADPFGTAARRDAVLAAWASSATRFREDANAEEDLVLGGYADRLLVELAQNASDAAARAGVPGRLRLWIEDHELVAANTGAPLDAGGVDGLTSLRASAKRDGETVGRFGVGFAAVLAVTDEPEVRSRGGGVRFSAARTRAEVASLGGAAAQEAVRRDGQVPVLRLGWPVDAPPTEGFDTEVRLPLLPTVQDEVRALLADFDPALLLGLPGLASVEIGERVIERRVEDGDVLLGGVRWRCVRAAGELPAELLAGRPVEERSSWQVLVAAPVGESGELGRLDGEQVVHAPTPSGEPLSLPVRVVATFPLEPSRRRVALGPIADFVVDRVAEAVAELALSVAAEPSVLALVPRPSLARAELDARICAAVLARLVAAPLLPVAVDVKERIAGRDAVVAAPALADAVELLAEVVPGLLPPAFCGPRHRTALDALGVREVGLGEAVEAVTSIGREPSWWRGLYTALAGAATGLAEADALAGLPVPLADGRTVTGPRGLLLPDEGLPAAAVSALGLRVVHADAVHPLLERLGAQPATPRGLLADDRVRAEVAHSLDADDPSPIASAVLALVAAAGLVPAEEQWLGELALPADDGDWCAASELVLPGSVLDLALAEDAPFGTVDPELVERWGEDVLAAAGVLRTLELVDEPDVDLADVDELDLDGAAEWVDEVYDAVHAHGVPVAGVRIERLLAIRDLELIADWTLGLSLLADAPLRAVLAAPCYALTAEGARVEVPSYARWWLSTHPVLDGWAPGALRTRDAAALDGLYDLADAPDQELLALLGCRSGLSDVLDAVRTDPALADDVFARLADPSRVVTPALLREIYPRLAEALAGASVDPPDAVRVAPDRVVPASSAVVLDAPWLLSALGDRSPIPAGSDPEAVADLLDIPLLSELGSRI